MRVLRHMLIWSLIVSIFVISVRVVLANEAEDVDITEVKVSEDTTEASTDVIDTIYNNAKDSVNPYWEDAMDNLDEGLDGAGNVIDAIGLGFLTRVVKWAKDTVVWAFLLAEIVGIPLICFSGLNKTLKRTGFGIAVGIPVLWLILIFGLSILISSIYY